ncbi:MAG: hypothetical protein HY951_03535 [Bacteroidia bacterium]|nr:hypothetical protein [Bacteroidia bacterium]
MKQKIFTITLLIAFVGIILIDSGCRKKEPAPAMPPSSTMSFNYANFNDTTGLNNKATHVNFFHSAVNVGFWNLILTVTLFVPVSSYAVAVNQDAEWDNHDKTWTWEYNFNSWGLHHAVLTAKLDQDTVDWKMKIDNFEWYYGRSHTNGSGGYWVLNESTTQQTPLLRIDWALNSSSISSIKYTNVAPASSTNNYKNNGEYIRYGTVANTEFDRFYDVFMKNDANPTQANLTEIEWHFADGHGHVKDPNKYSDSNWHCWDTSYADVVCP